MNEVSMRIIKSKGKEYVQQVSYKWDPVSKRGITRVVRHLGPLKPLTRENYTDEELRGLKKILAKRKSNTRKKLNMDAQQSEPSTLRSKGVDLTPPNEVIEAVIIILEERKKPMNRTEVFKEYIVRYSPHPEDRSAIKTQIGFSLTILERGGKIMRSGGGFRGNPYMYSMTKSQET